MNKPTEFRTPATARAPFRLRHAVAQRGFFDELVGVQYHDDLVRRHQRAPAAPLFFETFAGALHRQQRMPYDENCCTTILDADGFPVYDFPVYEVPCEANMGVDDSLLF